MHKHNATSKNEMYTTHVQRSELEVHFGCQDSATFPVHFPIQFHTFPEVPIKGLVKEQFLHIS